jgi:antitoxin component YwqK of YwqJK toxin-antitoxin module
MKLLVPLFAALLVAGCGEKAASDSAIKEAIEEAVDFEALEYRNGLRYQVNESEPYSGWSKRMYFLSEQIESLAHFKDGKLDGLATHWYKNGQKQTEKTYKDGESVSQRSWPSKGGEEK